MREFRNLAVVLAAVGIYTCVQRVVGGRATSIVGFILHQTKLPLVVTSRLLQRHAHLKQAYV